MGRNAAFLWLLTELGMLSDESCSSMSRLAVPHEAVRQHGSRQRDLKRMPKPDQVLRIERNYVGDKEKKGDG